MSFIVNSIGYWKSCLESESEQNIPCLMLAFPEVDHFFLNFSACPQPQVLVTIVFQPPAILRTNAGSTRKLNLYIEGV